MIFVLKTKVLNDNLRQFFGYIRAQSGYLKKPAAQCSHWSPAKFGLHKHCPVIRSHSSLFDPTELHRQAGI